MRDLAGRKVGWQAKGPSTVSSGAVVGVESKKED
jgi:hypothetical protein